ncbi:VOC family protein [Nocardia yamanashiensis]|uniref:VOC family protein n=1 Tax=Nocardia yamanashiensis TaxID=209247 RepID=UPI0008312614|nr:VOC family protein [Nocardia yamanashiensis]
MAVAHLGSITLDCDDPSELAIFWAELLRGRITAGTEKFVSVKLPHLVLTAIRVPDYRPPSWPDESVPKQIHLDLVVTDLDEAQHRAVELGARVADHQSAPSRCRVLFDPAGHPFCLCLPPVA